MNLPAGICIDWLASQVIPASVYSDATQLFDAEEYGRARDAIEPALEHPINVVAVDAVAYLDAVVLYGKCCFYLKQHDRLSGLMANFDEATREAYPALQVLRLWDLIQSGNAQVAFDEAAGFEAANLTPVSRHLAEIRYARGIAEYMLGRADAATESMEIAHALHSLLGDRFEQSVVANYLGFVLTRRSNFAEGLKWLQRALGTFSDLSLDGRCSMTRLNMGIAYYKMGDYVRAARELRVSLEIGKRRGWLQRQCFANIALGNVGRLRRDFEGARRHLHEGYHQAQQLGFPREEALALEFLGDVYRDDGQPVAARRFYARALSIGLATAPEGDIVMEVHRRVGECHALEGDHARALPELRRSLVMSRAQHDRVEEGTVLRLLAEIAQDMGDWSNARRQMDQSVSILTGIGARHDAAIALMRSSRLHLAELEQGRSERGRIPKLDAAWQQAMAAMDLFLKVDVDWWTAECRALLAEISRLRTTAEADAAVVVATGDGAVRYAPGDVVIHASTAMKDLLQMCDVFAKADDPVLVTGDTGTGKEVLARRVHARSDRHARPLVVVNVAAISHTMFEREFFGHVKGAFSGADSDAEGYAGRADGGTLFLDEIGDLPLEMQPKLLRLLQDGTYQALGDPRQRRTNIRLVAATNANLQRLVSEGRFRSDLYYRLSILGLQIQPLRNRREDILPLLRHFLSLAAGRHVDLAEYFDRESLVRAELYDWPGNAREVAMVARRVHFELSARGRVDLDLGSDELGGPRLSGPRAPDAGAKLCSIAPGSDSAERARILMALEENGGSRMHAARMLGIGRSTLYRRMEKLGIPTRRD